MENIRMTRKMAKGLSSGQMEENIMAFGKMVVSMEKASLKLDKA